MENKNEPKTGLQRTTCAYLDHTGMFHCGCGGEHIRGPLDSVDLYRCLACGNIFRVELIRLEKVKK